MCVCCCAIPNSGTFAHGKVQQFPLNSVVSLFSTYDAPIHGLVSKSRLFTLTRSKEAAAVRKGNKLTTERGHPPPKVINGVLGENLSMFNAGQDRPQEDEIFLGVGGS